ncbi:PadR family transcriptional regulator [Salininema proteolyticum]|uniref:PadR family transcriptional regulator n=1 Tax=Salininema proteolyticum TaxID=1607685 RepID=A0ABV8TSP4_9ACTN
MAGKELNATSAALLGLLHEGSMTGGQLMAEATRRLGPYWTMTRSQVYRELPALAEAGYVRVGKPGPRASVPYTISASGKRAFTRWLNEPTRIGLLRDTVALKTVFADAMSDGARAELYDDATEQHQEALANARELAKEYSKEDPGAAAAMEFAVGYHRSAINWLKKR